MANRSRSGVVVIKDEFLCDDQFFGDVLDLPEIDGTRSEPPPRVVGDIWYNTEAACLSVWDGTRWVHMGK